MFAYRDNNCILRGVRDAMNGFHENLPVVSG
jgi:hypothetical protein